MVGGQELSPSCARRRASLHTEDVWMCLRVPSCPPSNVLSWSWGSSLQVARTQHAEPGITPRPEPSLVSSIGLHHRI